MTVDDALAFRFRNGALARDLDEFARVLTDLPADVVDHHRTHYHHWVRDVLGDAGLAERYRRHGESGMHVNELRRVLVDLARARSTTPPLARAVSRPRAVKRSPGREVS